MDMYFNDGLRNNDEITHAEAVAMLQQNGAMYDEAMTYGSPYYGYGVKSNKRWETII